MSCIDSSDPPQISCKVGTTVHSSFQMRKQTQRGCLAFSGSHSREGGRLGLKPRQAVAKVLPHHTALLPQKDFIKHDSLGGTPGSQALQEVLSDFPHPKRAPLSLHSGSHGPAHSPCTAQSTLTHTSALSLWIFYSAGPCSSHKDMAVNKMGKNPRLQGADILLGERDNQ